jgi:hypothetical protein
MSSHYGSVIEPEDMPEADDGFDAEYEMQMELADIARERERDEATEKFYENLLWEAK